MKITIEFGEFNVKVYNEIKSGFFERCIICHDLVTQKIIAVGNEAIPHLAQKGYSAVIKAPLYRGKLSNETSFKVFSEYLIKKIINNFSDISLFEIVVNENVELETLDKMLAIIAAQIVYPINSKYKYQVMRSPDANEIFIDTGHNQTTFKTVDQHWTINYGVKKLSESIRDQLMVEYDCNIPTASVQKLLHNDIYDQQDCYTMKVRVLFTGEEIDIKVPFTRIKSIILQWWKTIEQQFDSSLLKPTYFGGVSLILNKLIF